ncbi:hypothetical protein CEUSTIGMA_g7720.t1 [Chlamydomonas eustigma]|uniref:Selenoprotein O n=1 Tax=Chlamydomonas eustigma TaxID=1157962 RepID=A0A250XBN3_9CHLO|nr:hypothetical protein CEUSTIGMA_g7720.t1 [Chlamydomonas eustigma]|eukprot:GAX80282.1 hypothetical protein CEUSTIGMA_g7720.t1 [Chlamydomonas eustigma]
MPSTQELATSSQHITMCSLEELKFDNSFVRELPGDAEKSNTIRQVRGSLYSRVNPTPAAGEPSLVTFSEEVCSQLLGLDPVEASRPEFALVFGGAAPLPGSEPYAQCYGGHQFGNWAGQLGDGRAITLGEILNQQGNRWELQLKGAGQTPYSRRADGRAVMRSSVREFVASEAMHYLGVPTTRALSLVGTGDKVLRDLFYDGNAKFEPGAVVCRVAPSFVRFGTFQLPASRGGDDMKLVKMTADYVIKHHYGHLENESQKYVAFLKEVTVRTAKLVSWWQAVGFVHGVLNTDNMSILGLTVDYGPYGFMDKFDLMYTPNMTDFQGRRYAYRNQPEIGLWNCVMLANALYAADLLGQEEAQEAVDAYGQTLQTEYNGRMAAKLGLLSYDRDLVVELFKLMYEDEADFTNTFRALGSVTSTSSDGTSHKDQGVTTSGLTPQLRTAVNKILTADREQAWERWLTQYRNKLKAEGRPDQERQAAQDAVNPKFVPRQHLLQYAVEGAEAGDPTEINQLMKVLRRPYDEQPGADPKYSALPPPEMADKPGVCVLSCSS